MKRDRTNDTLPNPPAIDRTDPGPVPRFDPGDPTPPPTEAEAREAGALLARVKRAPRIVTRVGERPSDGAVAIPGSAEHRERVQREIGDLARSAQQPLQPTGGRGRDDTTVPPVVARRARRRMWLMSGFAILLAACVVIGITFALRQAAPTLSSSASAPTPIMAQSSVGHDAPKPTDTALQSPHTATASPAPATPAGSSTSPVPSTAIATSAPAPSPANAPTSSQSAAPPARPAAPAPTERPAFQLPDSL